MASSSSPPPVPSLPPGVPTSPVAPNAHTVAAATGYFVDQKKGEVNELKQLLKNINVERDPKRKREIIKKVIAYMTLGIDVSRLFTDMIMAIETKDIVVKKMVYLYLCNYAHKEPEMAIMCINTLRRDCDNEDPMVRGLALRSLSSLRMESILEYVQQPIQKSLNDISPYVRKNGVLAVLKLKYLSPALIETNGYVAQLYRMMEDVDANVVTNVIYALNELLLSEGGMEITQATILSLLNRISEFSEWGLNAILELVARYNPTSEDETYAIMNLLDPVLRTANSGAVLATLKCFMKLSTVTPELQPQIIARSKPPMLTLITGGHPEVQYTLLLHLQLLLRRKACQGVFNDEFRQLYVRYNEPPYVKYLKVDILPLLANDANARDIATELGEYVADVDAELSKRAIAAIAAIGMNVSAVSAEMANTLVSLVEMDMPYVRAEAVKHLVNVLRVFPAITKEYILPSLSRCFKRVEDSDARAALIWIVGEYGRYNEITEAPYMLEPFIDNYEEENSLNVKLQLLSSTMKLFFQRPPETQAMLGRLLKAAMNDVNNQDVHDRALLYYRLLATDLTVAQSLFAGLPSAPTTTPGYHYAELREDEKNGQIFTELNTLAVLFGKPSAKFTAEPFQLNYTPTAIPDYNEADPSFASTSSVATAAPVPVTSTTPMLPVAPSSSSSSSSSGAASASHTTQSSNNTNLLDFGDDFAAPIAPTPTVTAAPTSGIQLSAAVELSPQRFQQLWLSLPEGFNGRVCGLPQSAASVIASSGSTAGVEASLRQCKIATMASGPLPPGGPQGLKLFVYAAEASSQSAFDLLSGGMGGGENTFLAQIVVTTSPAEVTATIKATQQQQQSLRGFVDVLKAALSLSFGPVQP